MSQESIIVVVSFWSLSNPYCSLVSIPNFLASN